MNGSECRLQMDCMQVTKGARLRSGRVFESVGSGRRSGRALTVDAGMQEVRMEAETGSGPDDVGVAALM